MWNTFTDLEQAKRSICTGYGARSIPFTHVPFLETMLRVEDYSCMLDFGCGIGRNLKYLVTAGQGQGAQIIGYDFPNMITLAKEYLGEELWNKIIWVNPPLNNLNGYSFNLIIATIVFQHIPREYLRDVLKFLSEHLEEGGVLFVYSRGYLDQGGNIWPHLLEHFEPVTVLDPTKGDETHQAVIFKEKQ